MSKANFKKWAFNLFLKSVKSETVRKSAGREFHAAGPENEEGALSKFGTQPRCDVARRV